MSSRKTIISWLVVPIAGATAMAALAGACADKSVAPEGPTFDAPASHPAAPPPGKGKDGGGSPGGGDTGLGNNLANPVIFAEGLGLTGLPVTDATTQQPIYLNTGLRPTATEGLTVTELPFSQFVPDGAYQTVIDGVAYYEQKTPNAWQPQWRDAKANGEVAHATVDWADNLVRQTWTANSVIRVEVVLNDLLNTDVLYPDVPTPLNPQMTGFNMRWLEGSGKTELWGTDGTTGAFNATIYSVCPRLTITKCQGEYVPVTATCNGSWVQAIDLWTYDGLTGDGPGFYSAEVNVSGKVIFGYNWMLRQMPEVINGVPIDKAGWWRLAFSIDDGGGAVACNAQIDNIHPADLHAYFAVPEPAAVTEEETGTDPVLYEPRLVSSTTTELDVYVKANKGGGQGHK